MVGLEDDPFLLGPFVTFQGLFLLNFGRVMGHLEVIFPENEECPLKNRGRRSFPFEMAKIATVEDHNDLFFFGIKHDTFFIVMFAFWGCIQVLARFQCLRVFQGYLLKS